MTAVGITIQTAHHKEEKGSDPVHNPEGPSPHAKRTGSHRVPTGRGGPCGHINPISDFRHHTGKHHIEEHPTE